MLEKRKKVSLRLNPLSLTSDFLGIPLKRQTISDGFLAKGFICEAALAVHH